MLDKSKVLLVWDSTEVGPNWPASPHSTNICTCSHPIRAAEPSTWQPEDSHAPNWCFPFKWLIHPTSSSSHLLRADADTPGRWPSCLTTHRAFLPKDTQPGHGRVVLLPLSAEPHPTQLTVLALHPRFSLSCCPSPCCPLIMLACPGGISIISLSSSMFLRCILLTMTQYEFSTSDSVVYKLEIAVDNIEKGLSFWPCLTPRQALKVRRNCREDRRGIQERSKKMEPRARENRLLERVKTIGIILV